MNRIRCFLLHPTGESASETTEEYTAIRPLYRDDDGRVFSLSNERWTSDDGRVIEPAPPGAIWDAEWYRGAEDVVAGDDGMILVVRTPAGDWVVDQRNRLGGGWKRTGAPPDVTVTPSIRIKSGPREYHGFLRSGYLEEC